MQFLTEVPNFGIPFPRAASPRPPVRRRSRGLSGPRQFCPVPWRNQQTRPPQERLILRDRLEVRILPEPPIRACGGTSRHARLRSGCPPGVEVQLLPGPPTTSAGGQAQSPRVFHKHASSVQLGVPHPISVRFFQQQDASLTSRRWGCNSLTGHAAVVKSGRYIRLRAGRRKAWRFESSRPHQRRHGEAAPHLFREQA